jgi:hypothetical protein
MDWDQSVNAEGEIEDAFDPQTLPAKSATSSAGEGPCLYFGPAGERCDRPATSGGFCSRHQRDALSPPAAISPRRLAVFAAILALLWPILADVVRELLRLFR